MYDTNGSFTILWSSFCYNDYTATCPNFLLNIGKSDFKIRREDLIIIYKLLTEQFIEQPIDVVFDFFSKPENLEEITPPRLRFKIITPSPIIMEKGSVIDYYIKILGISVHWQTLITTFVPPYRFIDEQIKGPYSLWHHTHTFSEENGGTMIRDEVRYIVPAGFLGQIMNFIWIKKDLDDIFSYRKEVISEKFSEPKKNINSTNFNLEV
ncbi:MAG: SRPBCC family protein [Candidatus Neomarinimicrobiota bacterium]|nr:SRPBCC family protein [Candidatus Neomarinimicrobiota bacterium]